MARSSLERVQNHLKTKGARTPVSEDLHGDLRSVVRRCDSVRNLGDVYGSIELSPYMKSLLRVSGFEAAPRRIAARTADTSVAASV